MIHQQIKDLCFALARPLLGLLGCGYRALWFLWKERKGLRLHLGCGGNYLPSFVNVDANPFRKIDLWLDVRNPLPFPDGVAEGIYLQETLEHFYPDECEQLLKECFRALQPGGYIRIGVPHLCHAIEAYKREDAAWFSDWPRSYCSLGGKLSNFLLCDGQHRGAFDFSMLEEMLRASGFESIRECQRGVSEWMDPAILSPLEVDSDKTTPARHLYVEARRP